MIKGTLFSLSASLLFGVMYYLSTFLTPLSGQAIFGVRMVITLPFLFLTLLLLNKQHEFIPFLRRLKHSPYLLAILAITASLVGFQMWLFLYAPNNGKAIEVSFGYLLLPIMMALVGKVVYREPLSLFKWLAILLACIGVISNIFIAGRFSWEAVSVFICYPLYFMLRRQFGLSHLHSFVVEIMLLIPVSIYFITQIDTETVLAANPSIWLFILLLGIISGSALMSYTMASTLLPFNLLGLLGYVEPCFMLLIAFAIGESLSQDAYLLMCCLILSLTCLVLDGVNQLRKRRRHV